MARVLLVGRGAPERGGIPTFLAQLAEGVDGHRIDFLNLAENDEKDGGRFSAGNVARTLRDVEQVWRATPGHDIVHIHSALLALPTIVRAGALAATARARGAKVVVHAHGGRLIDWLTPRRRPLLRVALGRVDVVIAVSEKLHDTLAPALAPGRLRLVRNGVETDRFSPASPRTTPNAVPTVLYVGGLTARKGVLDLINASKRVLADGLDHRLLLVGGIPDEGADAFDEVVRAAESPHIERAGPVPREVLPDIYRSADVFCLPSWWEAAPLSLLEAMASALPAVVTRVGDVPAMVRPDESALLVEPHDVDALAGALATLLGDPDLRDAFGCVGRRHVEANASMTSTRASLADVYAELGGPTP